MTIFCSLPVPLSLAETCRMPLASMSKVTSICGMPRGAGGMSDRSKRPSDLLSLARSRSPCSTWIVTAGWLSSAVENTCVALVGIVVFFSISLVMTAAERLDAERQRRHVEQQHVLDLARQHAALDRGADGDRLVGVDVLARLLAEEVLDRLLHQRHARLAADQDHLGDVGERDARVLDRRAARPDRPRDQLLDQRLELGAGQLDVEVLRARRIGRDVRQVDVGLLARGQLDLGLLGRLLEALHRERVLADVDARLLAELVGDVVDDPAVEVLAAEEGVAVGREHLELALAVDLGDLDDRDVEGAAAEVIHRDLAVAAGLVEAVGERRGGRLVDDALDGRGRRCGRRPWSPGAASR